MGGKNFRLVIIRANSLDRENRATKIIKTSSDAGFRVTFLGWDRGFDVPRSEKSEAGEIFNEINLKLKAPWGIASILFLPVWWIFVFYKLMIIEWDVAHAIQIISIPPVVIAGKIRRKRVVYDLLDTYEDSVIIPGVLRDLLVFVDKIFMRLSDYIVLADEEQIEELNGIPHDNITVIYDSPPDMENISTDEFNEEKFTLFFAGLLYSGKHLNLDKIFAAIKNIDNIKLVIAGHGNLVDEIKRYSSHNNGKIEFIGEISHREVLQRSYSADLLFMIRDSTLPVNRYICGSKLLEAMMCSKAIIVSHDTSTAHKVVKESCGIVVNPQNVREIKNAIIKLKNNPELCKKLGQNGRKAYEERYGWHIMEKRLINIYNDI